MNYTPLKRDLEKLWFKYEELWLMHKMILKLEWTPIMYFDEENEMCVGNKVCYPESFDDIKTIIRLFTK